MKAFTEHTGIVVPLDRANVDTDQIIPKQFLKSIKRTGFGENLFDAWRFKDEGRIGKPLHDRTIDDSFVLNDPRYINGTILLSRRNFGCGSSREHAVWALLQYGFKCVIAPSFADIFFNNSVNNGLLPVIVPEEDVDALFGEALQKEPMTLHVSLSEGHVSTTSGSHIPFEIDATNRERLLRGLDEIGLTLKYKDEIASFEEKHRQRAPWLF